jgi:hypothetical protein
MPETSAWETWQSAGADYARECLARNISVVPLGEKAFQYAASRGLPHQDIIRRAFVEGYRSIATNRSESCKR